ncbi:MAG: glycoside hydrolase family 3 protein [Nitrosomonadales bacterium]|nr:glycoside hydrolase family 3 protein [Nitrosomonadales bacterium]
MTTVDALRLAPFHLDEAAIQWVEGWLRRLTTEQKVRQLFNLPAHSDDAERTAVLAGLQVGGITRYGGTDLENNWRAARTLIESAEIPLLISGDIEGGAIGMPFGTPMPNQLGLAATGSTALNGEAVEVLAREARAMGFNWTFTPVLDINAAFRSAIVATRSYGSDPDTILKHALVNMRTFQRHGIAATAKHWPGEGFDDRDQHLVTTINPLDMAAWRASFGRLYRGLIDAGVMSVMSAHIALPAWARQHGASGLEALRPASVSKLLNQDLLRGELGFNGLIVSDASGMAGLSAWAPRAQSVPEVIAHGCDVLLFPGPFETDLGHIMAALSDGRLSEVRIEEAVTRVLGLKAALGLHRKSLDELLPPLDAARNTVRCPEHLGVAARVSAASVTLVKDVKSTLPLRVEKHRRVVVMTDPQRVGFAGHGAMELQVQALLTQRGFEVRAFDPEQPPTPADTDLVLYLLAQESLLSRSHIYMDWARIQGDWRGAMQRYWHTLPCVLVSFGHPYYMYDAPRMPSPVVAGEGAEQIIDVRNAFTMVSMMQDVVKHGTATRAMQLGRQDLAGKTGTTSDSIDAWFCGFQPTLVGISWMGFDQPRSLGDKETGGGAALPIWMSYMEKVLKDVPQAQYSMPDNMIAARINESGRRDENGSLIEYFYQENLPTEQSAPLPGEGARPADMAKDQLL